MSRTHNTTHAPAAHTGQAGHRSVPDRLVPAMSRKENALRGAAAHTDQGGQAGHRPAPDRLVPAINRKQNALRGAAAHTDQGSPPAIDQRRTGWCQQSTASRTPCVALQRAAALLAWPGRPGRQAWLGWYRCQARWALPRTVIGRLASYTRRAQPFGINFFSLH